MTALADAAPLAAVDAPFHVAAVTLAARAPGALARFYEGLGLARLADADGALVLGAGGAGWLRIVAATAPDRPAAGLFHTAIVLPSRAALGRWFAAQRAAGLIFEGASDHGVSEAFYLSDAEGNGVEVYADRPRAAWAREGDGYAMTTHRMDVAALLAEGGGPVRALPPETRIGHVHLRAADLAAAERLYVEGLGMAVTHRRPGAAWFGAGDYHHHLAVNAWSGPLPPRRPGQPGLEAVTLAASDHDARARLAAGLAAAGGRDPSGVVVLLEA